MTWLFAGIVVVLVVIIVGLVSRLRLLAYILKRYERVIHSYHLRNERLRNELELYWYQKVKTDLVDYVQFSKEVKNDKSN